jgi:adenylate cyclase
MQKVVEDAQGRFAGVLRVGLMKTQIDRAVPLNMEPHQIFICDNQGRLITGFGEQDHIAVSGDDLRIVTEEAHPMVMRALQEPALKTIDADHPLAATSFRLDNKIYLCTFSYLPKTQDWIVGIVVPREAYLGPLQHIRQQVIWASLGLIIIIILAGGLIVRSVVSSHAMILRETSKMNHFEFSRSRNSSFLRDVGEVLAGLEKAKTAMRAMSKYVPVNLVRQLYYRSEEPAPGGKSCELSVLFTDIKDFTVISETMTPDELAKVLGRYLQVMAETLQAERGTIDKYIGDAVMTFWNAPEPVPGHEILACRAAVRCRDALQELYDSSTWGTTPRFETRFGLHRCIASVGHFGSPDRLNYTAIGDGINLTSRLEGLNKFYGTTIIASESIQAAAKDVFEFRLLDRVAVKGRTEGLAIYELLSERAQGKSRPGFMDSYEQAFALYQRGDFAAALTMFETQENDPPSRILAGRCREYLQHPPASWNGVHMFDAK